MLTSPHLGAMGASRRRLNAEVARRGRDGGLGEAGHEAEKCLEFGETLSRNSYFGRTAARAWRRPPSGALHCCCALRQETRSRPNMNSMRFFLVLKMSMGVNACECPFTVPICCSERTRNGSQSRSALKLPSFLQEFHCGLAEHATDITDPLNLTKGDLYAGWCVPLSGRVRLLPADNSLCGAALGAACTHNSIDFEFFFCEIFVIALFAAVVVCGFIALVSELLKAAWSIAQELAESDMLCYLSRLLRLIFFVVAVAAVFVAAVFN